MTRSANIENRIEVDAADFRALLDAAVDGIVAIDHEGNVVEFNPAAQRLCGYRAEEIVGRAVSELMPEPDRAGHTGYIQRYLKTGEKRIIGIDRSLSAEKAAEEERRKLWRKRTEKSRF